MHTDDSMKPVMGVWMPNPLLRLSCFILLVLPGLAEAAESDVERAAAIAAAWCRAPLGDPAELLPAGAMEAARHERVSGAGSRRRSFSARFADGGTAAFDMILFQGSLRRLRTEIFDPVSGGVRPSTMVQTGADCLPALARRLRYAPDLEAPIALEHLGQDLATVTLVEDLDPPVPAGRDPGGVTVAHVDSGVNYLLPHIGARLARDGQGRALGFDFWDEDPRPFDLDTSRSPFFPLRHGTAVASILLREAPEIRLVPYRYPRDRMERMAALVEAAHAAGARIVMMPLGSRRQGDWEAFRHAAEARSDMLFIVSAGNDGRDIDREPVYPAAFPLDNMITVTSSDPFGRLAEGSNWGRRAVDLLVPGEGIETIDHRGAVAAASGSSFAVPRVAALAARLLGENPGWGPEDLVEAIRARTARGFGSGPTDVAWGWIPNPADDGR